MHHYLVNDPNLLFWVDHYLSLRVAVEFDVCILSLLFLWSHRLDHPCCILIDLRASGAGCQRRRIRRRQRTIKFRTGTNARVVTIIRCTTEEVSGSYANPWSSGSRQFFSLYGDVNWNDCSAKKNTKHRSRGGWMSIEGMNVGIDLSKELEWIPRLLSVTCKIMDSFSPLSLKLHLYDAYSRENKKDTSSSI